MDDAPDTTEMNQQTRPPELAALIKSADDAMARGDARAARDGFTRVTSLAPGLLEPWLGLAACQRALGDLGGALRAVQGALTVDPRCFPALLMKGSLLEAAGDAKPAAIAYGIALKVAPKTEALAEPMRRAIARATQAHDAYIAQLAESLKAAVGVQVGAHSTAESQRVETFIEVIAGRRKIYPQEPVQFHYPGMPTIEFYDRETFPWLEELEARTDEIRAEALAVWRDRTDDLVPYVDYPDGLPLDQWEDLNRSLDWSAFHLFRDGKPVEANYRQCPATAEAIKIIDQPRVPGRSPAAMFSILKPRTRIPPHTGIANTRLVLHLPLIVPEGCGFRVGGETRKWREGEAWVFDDTIEHEAWNDSDLPRTILICDVWSPGLSINERELISHLMGEFDRFNGTQTVGADL